MRRFDGVATAYLPATTESSEPWTGLAKALFALSSDRLTS